MKRNELVGKIYGRLTVLMVDENKHDKKKNLWWVCVCECGQKRSVRGYQLTGGKTKSCGCIKTEERHSQKYAFKHGHCANGKLTKAHNIWRNMRQRCYNPKDKNYRFYGARGITVCERWKNSFENFLQDMGEPAEKMTIDRIDTYSGYSPENCRWVTIQENLANRGYSFDKSWPDGSKAGVVNA